MYVCVCVWIGGGRVDCEAASMKGLSRQPTRAAVVVVVTGRGLLLLPLAAAAAASPKYSTGKAAAELQLQSVSIHVCIISTHARSPRMLVDGLSPSTTSVFVSRPSRTKPTSRSVRAVTCLSLCFE